VTLRVEAMDGRRVERLRVRPVPDDDGAGAETARPDRARPDRARSEKGASR
jgi:hypothetical protein